VCVCLWVCYHDNSKLRASIFTILGSVGDSSDHLQLIKFWPSCTPGKGVCGGAKIFGSALLHPACSVCISPSPSTFFIIIIISLVASWSSFMLRLKLHACAIVIKYHNLGLILTSGKFKTSAVELGR